MHAKNCTTMDHIYPVAHADVVSGKADGTPCYCGKRRWNQDGVRYTGPTTAPKRPRTLRKGTAIELRAVPGIRYRIAELDREAGMLRVEGLAGWHELADVA